MIEPNEVVNLIASSIFFIFFVKLNQDGRCSQIPKEWVVGILFLTLSNICTVVEGFTAPVLFNITEHVLFLSAAIIFLLGALRMNITE